MEADAELHANDQATDSPGGRLADRGGRFARCCRSRRASGYLHAEHIFARNYGYSRRPNAVAVFAEFNAQCARIEDDGAAA